MSTDENHKESNEKQLKAALELYDNAPCGSVSFNNEGYIININQTLCTWLGYSKDEIILKRRLPSLFKIGGQIFFETHFFPLIKMQGFINEVYFDILKKDKSIFHALINVREVPPSKIFTETSYQAIILDVSDRRHYEVELLRAKEKAEQDSNAKAEFLATISHEIRTPLNAILGIGNLLHQTPLNKNQKNYAKLLLHSSEHLLGLVNNLLDLSKIEANKIILEKAPFNLFDLTQILHHTFAVKAEEKGIELVIEMDDKVPNVILGDPLKIKQILTNLIGNSIKFTKKGAVSLTVTLKEQKENLYCLDFAVSDTGIGIPKEKLEHIFQEFSQASYDVGVEFGGTGLGLTISKKLLELHDSKLSVESELNKGSTFSFQIWYEKSDFKLKKEKQISEKDTHILTDMRVLIVDDNHSNIFITEQYLEQWHIQYKSANSGKEALKLLSQTAFDLILLDLQMPEMDGYQTAEQIELLALDYKPVIVSFSAATRTEVEEKIKKVGIDDFLSKPFQPQELFQLLSRYYHTDKVLEYEDTEIFTPEINTDNIDESVNNSTETDLINTESFNLIRYEKMAKNNLVYLNKFKTSTYDALISYREDFNTAMQNKDVKALSGLIHQSTMTIFYIQADPLKALLSECRELMQQSLSHPSLDEKTELCKKEFDTIIAGLAVT